MEACTLEHYRVVVVHGEDRIEFLQGQLTQDVRRVDAGHSMLSGWTTAKGRLLAVGQLIAVPGAMLWPLPHEIVDEVVRRLRMFVLRARATIDVADLAVIGLCGLAVDEPARAGQLELGISPGAAAYAGDCAAARVVGDPGRAWLCGPADRLRADCDAAGCEAGRAESWHLADVRAALPTVVASTSEAFIPQMLNLDLLDGISFAKGCYIGQEIVARTQNLGRIKRRMYRFGSSGSAKLPAGAVLHGPDGTTGKVVMAARSADSIELTAVIPIDHAEAPWFTDAAPDTPLALLPLPYPVSAG